MRKPRYWLTVVCLLSIADGLLRGGTSASGLLTAHFINVGQGDCSWLRLPNGDDILVDGGKPQAGPTVVAYLSQHGVSEIELLVATHGDADHIGGLLDVLASINVQQAWLDSWRTCTTGVSEDFYQALEQHQVVTATVRMGESYPLGDVTALVLNPSEPLYADRNENSVVLRVSYGSVDLLLTGDAESDAEGRMLRRGLPLEAEVLKVSHHGSNSGSGEDFLAAVTPQEAIISVGPNSYGHPRPEVVQRLAYVGATVWRTDECGTIVVTTDGTTYSVTTEFGPTVTPTVIVVYGVFLPAIIRMPVPALPSATPTQIGTLTPSTTPTATASPTATSTETQRSTATLTATATSTPSPTLTATPEVNTLRITALQYAAHDEYVEVTNDGPAAQNMTNWRIQSVVGDQWYTFPSGYVLEVSSWVRVHSGPEALDQPPMDVRWSGSYIWNNDGDEARLIDNLGMEQDSWSY